MLGNIFNKAAMMIVDVAKFFIEKGSQIIELVDAFVQSISAIAAGSVGKVAEMIERALSLSVPLLIGMFTSLLGLGDLADKVKKIFKKITGRITGAIDGFIEKAGTWFKDKKGRRKERKEKKDKEKAEKNKKDRPSKLEAGKDKNKEENNDQRNDKQKKTAFDKGMKLGAAVVNNENLSNQEIKVELNQLELKYKLKELDAKLMSEKEDLQTWILSGQLDTHKGIKKIERKPTKAENEEDVSEEDRKLHVRIAAEIKSKLEAKSKSTEAVETFEEFYSLLQSEAVMLQKKYQPQLRNGIKIAVDLVNQVQQDKKDGDVDVRIKIAPNTVELINEFGFKETGPNEEAEEMAVMVFNEVIDSNVESYWQSDRYKAILKKKSKNEDITELHDSALIDLYQKIETDFKQEIVTWKEIPSNVTFKFDLRGINPSRKLLYLLNKEGKECASTTLTYSGGETVTNINELKERIVKISKTAYYKPASSYKKHVKGTSNEQRSQNSENGGAGQYFYELSDNDISELERLALQNSTIQQYREREGTPTVNDNQYYFLHSCSDDVGFVNGDETNQISVEITSANTKQEIHSHPR